MFCPLVKIDVVAHMLNRSARQIFDLVDGGSPMEAGLMWVFNLARNSSGHRRDLRFWDSEIKARAAGEAAKYHNQDLAWVLSQIMPVSRQSFPAGEVSRLLQVRHQTRLSYGEQLPGRRHSCGNTYERPALEHFLRLRWIGNFLPRPTNPVAAQCKTGCRLKMEAVE